MQQLIWSITGRHPYIILLLISYIGHVEQHAWQNQFPISDLTEKQIYIIAIPIIAPENYYQDGEIYGKPIVKSYIFNENYYYSNEFYGLLAEGKVNGNNYLRLIDNIKENYIQSRIYAEYEINN